MKKIHLVLCSVFLILSTILLSCANKGEKNSKTDESTENRISTEMTEFMAMLQGKSDATDAALNKFASDSLDKKDMNMYDLENPKVISTDKNCHTLEAKSGMTTRTYVLCWENGKIKTIEDKGMK